MNKYHITLYSDELDALEEQSFVEYNKDVIQKTFDNLVSNLQNGQSVEYSRDTEKYIGDIVLTVVKKNNKLFREVVKGDKVYLKAYKR